jgi:hypothetical protein
VQHTKQEALARIEALAGAEDRIAILSKVITVAATGAGGGALTSVLGSSTVALGPVVIGLAASAALVAVGTIAGAAAGYGLYKLVAGAGISEGRRRELLAQYAEIQKRADEAERRGDVKPQQKTEFIASLRELVKKAVIEPDFAFRLIEQTNEGRIPLSHATEQVASLLREAEKKTAG